MKILQKEVTLQHYDRGFHLITSELLSHLPEIKTISTGFLNIFIKHTSASITINEDADPTVRKDFETHFNKMVPDGASHFIHTAEGPDDMPAHIKSSMLGASLVVPVTNSRMNLGTWQGIYLCEHRNNGGRRKLVLTLWGID